jgi:protease stability complex PrcB-like protein
MSHENTKPRNPRNRSIGLSCFRVFVLSWLTITVMAAQPAPQPRTIEKGDQSNIENARQVLVRTDAELRQLWQQHAPERPMPKVDFSREMVVAVFMGSRPNAGFSTSIVSATAANGALIVRYTETRPPAGSVSAQVLTFPYHIVAIPKADVKDVKFEKVQ